MDSKGSRIGAIGLVVVLTVGLVWLGVVRYQADRRAVALTGVQAPKAAEPAAPPAPVVVAPAVEKSIWVHVTGAVVNPGVYELKAGARAKDAVAAAGGVLPGAAEHSLSLAQPLSDGEKVWVPTTSAPVAAADRPPEAKGATVGPVQSSSAANGTGGGTAAGSRPASGAVVNVNQASEAELAKVPGIGAVTAKAIVAYRKQHGPFKNIEELDRVKGIGKAFIEKIRAHVSV